MSSQPTGSPFSPEDLLAPAAPAGTEGVLPHPSVTARVAAEAHLVRTIAPGRLFELLTPPLCSPHPEVALQWLRDAGLLVHLLPELDATVAFSQEGGRKHKDVWDHTKAVVRQSVPRTAVRWAAVLHDIGKVKTRRFLPGGKVTFHGHAEEGGRVFRRVIARRIAFPEAVRERVDQLIRNHLRAGQFDGSWTESAVRRFAREMGPILTDLLDLSRADVTSRRPGKRQRCLVLLDQLAQRIEAVREHDARPKPLPAGLGNLLMHELGLPPGKHIGDLRAKLEALHQAGEIHGGEDAAYYLDVIRTRALMDGVPIRPPRGYARISDAGDDRAGP